MNCVNSKKKVTFYIKSGIINMSMRRAEKLIRCNNAKIDMAKLVKNFGLFMERQ